LAATGVAIRIFVFHFFLIQLVQTITAEVQIAAWTVASVVSSLYDYFSKTLVRVLISYIGAINISLSLIFQNHRVVV
jgi:hypothetical protein